MSSSFVGSWTVGAVKVVFSKGAICCQECGQPLAINKVDDVARCVGGCAEHQSKVQLRCPDCGSTELELKAELENGQYSFACKACGRSSLSYQRNIVFSTQEVAV